VLRQIAPTKRAEYNSASNEPERLHRLGHGE
jgi:hypothetical protein